MKVTLETLTTNQKTILCHADLPYQARADANHDFLTRIGFQAFQTAQFGLKAAGLFNDDYSLTPRGHELFKELMGEPKSTTYCCCALDELGAILHRDMDCPVHGDVDETVSNKPTKEDPAMTSTVANRPHQAKEVIRANLTKFGHADMFDENPEPWQCHDKGCLCHDEHEPTAKQVHEPAKPSCNCGLGTRGTVLDVNSACPIHGWDNEE